MNPAALASVSVVVVTWNSRADVAACLRSVLAAAPEVPGQLDITVIDNASRDATPDLVREVCPEAHLIQAPRNLGFGAAANIGIARAEGDAVLILNPDAELAPGALGAMLRRLHRAPDLGCVAPMHAADGRAPASPARRLPTLGAAFADGTLIQRFAPEAPALRRYYLRDAPHAEPEWLTGACLCFRRAALRAAGGFDPGYFMYAEETDLLRELRRRGWRCAVAADACIRHRGGASSSHDPVARERRFFRSRYRYVAKTWGWPAAAVLRVFVAASGLLRMLEQALRLLRPAARPHARRELRQISAVTLWQWTGWGR